MQSSGGAGKSATKAALRRIDSEFLRVLFRVGQVRAPPFLSPPLSVSAAALPLPLFPLLSSSHTSRFTLTPPLRRSPPQRECKPKLNHNFESDKRAEEENESMEVGAGRAQSAGSERIIG